MAIVTETKKIDGLDITCTNFPAAQCGDFCVYDDKVWRITASSNIDGKPVRILEREKAGERIIVKDNKVVLIKKIIKPTGHITI